MFPILHTPRFVLREYHVDDAAEVLRLRSDERVLKYLDKDPFVTIEQALEFLNRNRSLWPEKNGISWVITEKESGRYMGDFSFWRWDKANFRAEIGYSLLPDYWKQGVMKEVFAHCIPFGFQQLNLHSIEANINPANEASRALLLSTGFKKEAYFRENYYHNGMFLDSEIYSLLEKDMVK